jgi:hypothetical protein
MGETPTVEEIVARLRPLARPGAQVRHGAFRHRDRGRAWRVHA